jgi:exoribonuclease R
MYKLIVKDRKYTGWEVVSFLNDQNILPVIFNPIESKLFHEDVFSLQENSLNCLKSPVREKPFFTGVLVLTGNKTYGRRKNQVTMKTDKMLYKCVPNDPFLPCFLIPYEIKQMGFSKLFTNLYVTFKYDHWEEKHPYGTLLQVIGQVNDLPAFYEYQLYSKGLHTSINKFEKDTTKALQKTCENNEDLFKKIREKYSLEDRTKNTNVFTIDPEGSIDFDDAFSIQLLTNKENKEEKDNLNVDRTSVLLSIYISNVSLVLDTLELWESFAQRISTIYLPDKKRSMLPSLLGDHLCSLREKTTRVAFTMDVSIDIFEQKGNTNPEIQVQKIEFKNTLIEVKKNYIYEEPSLLKNLNYLLLLDTVRRLSKEPTYNYIPTINDSHDVIAFLMIWMNHECSKDFLAFNNGIFRSATSSSDSPKVPPIIVEKKSAVFNESIALFTLYAGKYINGEQISSKQELRHDSLNLDTYVHITSPIRRIVDLLNLIKIQENRKMVCLSSRVQIFYQRWINQIDFVNDNTKKIRKVQNQCTLLELITNQPISLEKKYDGIVFHRKEKGLGMYSYEVTLPELKIFSKIVTSKLLDEYSSHLFQIYVFQDEESFQKKIRLQLLEI